MSHRPPGRRAWLTGARLAAAAAGVVVAVIVVGMVWDRRPTAPPGGSGSTTASRGSDLQALEPRGDVEPPFVFRWSSPVAARRFILEIRDAHERVMYSGAVESEEVEANLAMLERLQPGETYQWRVLAMDAAGETILRSLPQAFTLSAAGSS